MKDTGPGSPNWTKQGGEMIKVTRPSSALIDLAPYVSRGVVPTKFGYLGAGAGGHSNYSASTDYDKNIHHIDFDLCSIAEFRDRHPCTLMHLVDLGAGDGRYAELLVRGLGSQTVGRYLAVDISPRLVNQAAVSVKNAGITHVETLIWDMEGHSTESIASGRDGKARILCLLFGNTLSNFENPSAALSNISGSMKDGDFLSLSVRRYNSELTCDENLGPYGSDSLKKAILSSFASGGIQGEFALEFQLEDKQIVGKAKVLELRYCPPNLAMYMTVGREFVCFRSRRWYEDDLDESVAGGGLSIRWQVHDRDFITLLAEKRT
jgi:Histidine-specific methyltransferase, SAM-dependent